MNVWLIIHDVVYLFIFVLLIFFLPSYLNKKAENLATKEDVSKITRLSEEVMQEFRKEFSEFEATLGFKNDIKKNQYEKIQQIKSDAILKSLDFLDDYISWMDLKDKSGNEVLAIRKQLTTNELTLQGRSCLNKLFVTVDNYELVNLYLSIILDKPSDGNIFEKYVEYKVLCRRELGQEKEVNNTDLRLSRQLCKPPSWCRIEPTRRF